jgi:mannosyltransferase
VRLGYTPVLRLTVGAAVGLACINFLTHLGTSSLFVDEVYSWAAANAPLGELIEQVRDNEVAPPVYYGVLHPWISWLGADSDWAMRLPSALCAIALVPVLYDIARRLAGETAGVAAAVLGALSPLVLDYAQETRAYAPAMLVCALVAACALRAVERQAGGGRWAAGAGLLAALAFAIHYTTAFATAPFLIWLVLRRSLPGWARAASVAPLVVVGLLLLPLMLDQLATGHQNAIAPFARLTLENALEVLGTPWDSRAEDPVGLHALAAAVTVGAVAWLFARRRPMDVAIAAAATAPVAAAFVATLISTDAMITRYTSISAPLALVAVAAAFARLPRVPRAAYAAVVLAIAVSGTIRGHGDEARFADARGASERIASEWLAGDVIVTPPNDVTVNLPVRYYTDRTLPAGAPIVAGEEQERVGATLSTAPRIWFVGRKDQDAVAFFTRAGFESHEVARFEGTVPVVLTRADRD